MKRVPICLLLSLLVVAECRERPKSMPVTSSPDYDKGVYFLNRRQDSAYFYFNKVASESKDSLQVAQAYNQMARIQNREGDYFGGQENSLASLKYLHPERENDQYCLVADYNVLGSTSLNLKNYAAAIGYYDQAIRWAKDDRSRGIALNNKALAYQNAGEYPHAIAIYDSILILSKKDHKDYSRVLTNLATTRWLEDPSYRAAPDLLEALRLRKEGNDDWGLNSSYAHLADYYKHSRPDSALTYARNMLAVATRLNSPDDRLEALQKLVGLAPLGEVKGYFSTYDRLRDSLETARNRAKNQFALIRYEAEKNKADNLRLQRENAERKADAVRQRALAFGALVIATVIIGWVVLWSGKRKQRLEWEKERAIQEGRFQISRKVHDVVGNGIYSVMTKIENGGSIEREQLLDELEPLYLQSRDISYESPAVGTGDFQGVVSSLLARYGTPNRKVLTKGNDPRLWEVVGAETKEVLKPVLQELMVNMDKHSRAMNVVVRFDRDDGGLNIVYSDDGVGFPGDVQFGNGLKNTGNRISELGGQITFEPNTPAGASIRIYLPNP